MAFATSPSVAENFPAVEKTFRNSRIYVGFILLMCPIAVFLGLCMFILVFTTIFPLSDFSGEKAISAAMWGFGAFSMVAMGFSLWPYGRRMAFNQAQFDTHGVGFQLGSKKAPKSMYFPWNEVSAVKHQRQGNVDYYFVLGRAGSSVQFNNYSFIRAKTIAREVAARVGQPIQEI
jgi:hypothetical protein